MPAQTSNRQLRELYQKGTNIISWFRTNDPERLSSGEAIRISYDLQSGSYVEALRSKDHAASLARYAERIAQVLDGLPGDSLLEAGVGEATTLRAVLSASKSGWKAAGFDASWSRVSVARSHTAGMSVAPFLFTGDLFQIPAIDSSFDVVFTSHAVEPNGGREAEALAELARVSRRWLVLCEPAYELGGDATKKRIIEHGYCRNLAGHAIDAGLRIVEHRLLDLDWVAHNQTGLLVLEKTEQQIASTPDFLACPVCRTRLLFLRDSYYCRECLSAYPVLDGIPCLLRDNAILATALEKMIESNEL